uniref:Uncharacterized protein n=1 Tax=Hanusia phi TaxID=3032 RepID=A0A7S0E4W3_9CRYP
MSKTVPREADNVTMIADDVYIFPSKYGLTSHPVLLSFEGPSDMNEDSNSMNFVSVDLDSSSGQNDSYTDVEQHSEMEHTKEGEDSTPRESHAEEERAGGSKELLLNGFATWGPLQLEREIHEGGWFLTPFLANASIVFDTPREEMYDRLMAVASTRMFSRGDLLDWMQRNGPASAESVMHSE